MKHRMADILKRAQSVQTELEGGIYLPKELADGLISYVESLENHYHEILDDSEKHVQLMTKLLPPHMKAAVQKILDSTKVG